MYNSDAALPYRWTEHDITSFYDDEGIQRVRRRSAAACGLVLLVATMFQPLLYLAWLLCTAAIALAMDHWLKAPLRSRSQYEALRATWIALLEQSSPSATMPTTAKLDDDEQIIYARPSQRYSERLLNGAAMSCFLEAGELIVTDRRVLFLGSAHTLAVDARDVLRYTFSYAGQRITFEYPQRPAGESFTVEFPLFALCMSRRGDFKQFSVEPPPPLPLDASSDVVTVPPKTTAGARV